MGRSTRHRARSGDLSRIVPRSAAAIAQVRRYKPDAAVPQLNGHAGEVWGAESATDRLVAIRATGK
jgi:streptogramin lyase